MKIILTLQSPLKGLMDLPIMLWELWSKNTCKAPFSHGASYTEAVWIQI